MCLWHVLVQHCSKEQFIFNPLHLPCSLFQKKIPSYIDQGSTAPYIAYNEFLKKVSKGGGHFQSNTADFGNFKQGFLIMKLIQISNFRVPDMFYDYVIVHQGAVVCISCKPMMCASTKPWHIVFFSQNCTSSILRHCAKFVGLFGLEQKSNAFSRWALFWV